MQDFLLSLVEHLTIWEQKKKDSLRYDIQFDFVVFLMYNCFLRSLNKMEDTLISSGDTLVLDLNISVARNFR